MPRDTLVFAPLGGAGEIGMNLNLYGYNDKWIMVDLGMSFADADLPGTELIFPETAFIEDLRQDLLGIVLTHGHEDHIGAVPYLWPELGASLYATPFTAGLLRGKLKEAGLLEQASLVEVPLGGAFELGPFQIRYVALAHSIPEGNALLIGTPLGRIFHTGDWKLDDEPVVGRPTLPQELTRIGDQGVLALVGDSTNVFNEQASGSEGAVKRSLMEVLAGRRGRVVVTTFASNVARLDSLGKVAAVHGRHVTVLGRSLERIIAVAKANGYLADFPPLLDARAAAALPREEVFLICTGCQGEPRAALSRIAHEEHRDIALSAGDTVVFSSKMIPGNEMAIGRLVNQLIARGIEVVTEKDAFVHVSGHPGQAELAAMYDWLRPRILIPVHGELRHMTAHAAFGRRHGIPHGLVPRNGDVVRLAPDGPAVIAEVEKGRLVLDGDDILPADSDTIVERRRIAYHGFVAATLLLDAAHRQRQPAVLVMKGVPGQHDAALEALCQDAIAEGLAHARSKYGASRDKIAEAVRIALRRAIRNYCGKKPVTEVRLVNLDKEAEALP
ncbi:MAG: ribonuclease J [Alphaproteobacteria bacterium]|nr:MAG: ribonuclease J [Alphaproteobacteria bacterium]